MDEVTGEWRKQYNEEQNDMYSSPNIVRVIKLRRIIWVGHVAQMGEGRGMYRVLAENPEGKRPLGRYKCRWEDNIKIDFQEVGCGVIDWIELALDRDRWWALVNVLRKPWVPNNAGNITTTCEQVSFSRRALLHGVSK
jgi:hypothetical protein